MGIELEITFRKWVLVVLFCASGCGGSGVDRVGVPTTDGGASANFDLAGTDDAGNAPVDLAGVATTHVAYRLSEDGHVYRVAAVAGAVPEDVSAGLTSAGSDSAVGLSRDGAWLGILTTRFGCGDWACLALVATSPTGNSATTGTLVMAGGAVVHSEGRPAIARGAAFVVYSAEGGPHTRDLWIAQRSAGGGLTFDEPTVLTTNSAYAIHELPALSADEQTIVADCEDANSDQTTLCTIGIDGPGADGKSATQPLVTLAQGPNGVGNGTEVHSGDFLPDGSLVFEADWMAEQIWRRDGNGALAQVAGTFTNDNSPCALPDGRVASLWLERPGNPMGYHELKVMTTSGDYTMLVTGVDVTDIGLGCGL
jgi:hypothetical protein